MIKKALRECIFTNENYSDRGPLLRVATIEIDKLVPICTSGLFTFYTAAADRQNDAGICPPAGGQRYHFKNRSYKEPTMKILRIR